MRREEEEGGIQSSLVHTRSHPHHPYPLKCIHYSSKVERESGCRGDGQRLFTDASLLVWILTGQLINDLIEDNNETEYDTHVGDEGEGGEGVQITYPAAHDDQWQNYDYPHLYPNTDVECILKHLIGEGREQVRVRVNWGVGGA